ncbi:uncharacterized protein NPIL_51701 [Nephila pilipes]|uniref:CCHC-type domain-containing protein n=1 Tax=Nephila pilipes TaxID=299642 RepID=A0A8X6U946_NEPPI|nr:uncharacterized protein NPIL_51701 [Nephila pilipes]
MGRIEPAIGINREFGCYENARHEEKKNSVTSNKPDFRSKFSTSEKRFKSTTTSKESNNEKTRRNVLSKNMNLKQQRRSIQCYECGTPGYIQSKYPSCSISKGEGKASVNSVNLLILKSLTSPSSLFTLKICGVEAAV